MILVLDDTRRLTYRLKKNGAVFPGLTGATLTWKLRKPDLTEVTETMTLESATTGKCYVDPVDGASVSHFDAVGEYQVEVIVERVGAEPEYPERPQTIYVRAEYEVADEG